MLAIELSFVGLLAAMYFLERTRLARIAELPGCSLAVLFALPIILRILLLFRYPIPSPGVSDDFAQLLSADTIWHLRLANPTHAFHRFFETAFTLQEPAYAAMFPPGQGILLALGKLLTGTFWGGPLLASGALAALTCWMLRGWVTPGWAFVGGILAAVEFGPLCEWTNTYWGGSLAACAGCLVFGALPRGKWLLLGLGIAIHMLTRPFETLFLVIAIAIYLSYKKLARVQYSLLPIAAAGALTILQNHAVTDNWTQLPYQISQWQYGVPTTMTFQNNPEPHRVLTREQELTVRVQKEHHGDEETPSTYFQRLAYRFRYLRFFDLAPIYIALPFFVPAMRQLRWLWVAGTISLFVFGGNFYPYFYPQYIAGVTCLFLLVAVVALERMRASAWLVRLSVAHFLFWYCVLAFADQPTLNRLKPYATWHVINMGDPEGRIAIRKQLEAEPGQQLVFVRYSGGHTFREWVHNMADIDASRIIWAHDLGITEDLQLKAYYPNRKTWLLEPDAFPPRLRPY